MISTKRNFNQTPLTWANSPPASYNKDCSNVQDWREEWDLPEASCCNVQAQISACIWICLYTYALDALCAYIYIYMSVRMYTICIYNMSLHATYKFLHIHIHMRI